MYAFEMRACITFIAKMLHGDLMLLSHPQYSRVGIMFASYINLNAIVPWHRSKILLYRGGRNYEF